MDIRYPIGQFSFDSEITSAVLDEWISQLEASPRLLREVVEGLSDKQLDTPYREGGWSPRQLVHHIADSNMNSYIRFKLAVTEDKPIVKTYDQTQWSELVDARIAPVEDSLVLLEALHRRWVLFLKSLSQDDLKRVFVHPDAGEVSLDYNVGIYAWHTRHHTAQITEMKKRNHW